MVAAAQDIKPIETVFDGHRFRSRLEARWAVVFKELCFKYEYEPEGFQLAGGVRYLPDFFIPEIDIHVEIKRDAPLSRAEWRKLILFAADGDRPLLLIMGSPGHHFMYLLDRTTLGEWAQYDDEDDSQVEALVREAIESWGSVEISAVPQHVGYRLIYGAVPPLVECNLSMAFARGAQARFEHGRRG